MSKARSAVQPQIWPLLDEVWDYSRANLQLCGTLPPAGAGRGRAQYPYLGHGAPAWRTVDLARPPVLRYVPPDLANPNHSPNPNPNPNPKQVRAARLRVRV